MASVFSLLSFCRTTKPNRAWFLTFFYEAIQGLAQQSYLEWLAASLSVAYLLLAVRQNQWCWPCALASTALYTWIFFDAALQMESALNVYYMAMAVYGYWSWNKKGVDQTHTPIITWSVHKHVIAIGSVIAMSGLSGYLLIKNQTGAAWPYLDSFTTWGAVLTTYMVAKKVFESEKAISLIVFSSSRLVFTMSSMVTIRSSKTKST